METITGTGAGTGNVFDPSNAGYPLLVAYNQQYTDVLSFNAYI
jgi:hypothetical protein